MIGKIGRTLVFILVSLAGIMNAKANKCAIEDTCKAGETCCELMDGQHGCCPYPNGICCPNQEHCCPSGYYCLHKTCVRQSAIPSVYKMASKEIDNQYHNSEKCPPDFTSCINNKDGQTEYCCPVSNAVCCNDQQHCCPAGTKCSSQKRGCEWEPVITPFVLMMNAFPIRSSKRLTTATIKDAESDTPCPHSEFSCPPNNTCCLNERVRYVCCPFKDAACCALGTYCCPYGSYCIGSMHCKPIR